MHTSQKPGLDQQQKQMQMQKHKCTIASMSMLISMQKQT